VNRKVEYIKKLMGWCPNTRAYEAKRHVNLENFDSDVPDRARGENGDLKNPGWFRRIRNQMLLAGIFLTFMYFLIINHTGFLPFALICGLFTGLAAVVAHWNRRIEQYDVIAKKPVVRYVPKKKSFWISLTIIFFILVSLFFLPYIPKIGTFITQFMFSFSANVISMMWGAYFLLIYWEKKNHMKIYRENVNSYENTYAIEEKEGEL
jgi:hypothetical protein